MTLRSLGLTRVSRRCEGRGRRVQSGSKREVEDRPSAVRFGRASRASPSRTRSDSGRTSRTSPEHTPRGGPRHGDLMEKACALRANLLVHASEHPGHTPVVARAAFFRESSPLRGLELGRGTTQKPRVLQALAVVEGEEVREPRRDPPHTRVCTRAPARRTHARSAAGSCSARAGSVRSPRRHASLATVEQHLSHPVCPWYRGPAFWSRTAYNLTAGCAPLAVLQQSIRNRHPSELILARRPARLRAPTRTSVRMVWGVPPKGRLEYPEPEREGRGWIQEIASHLRSASSYRSRPNATTDGTE
jgi:hypothetical protein